MSTRTFMIALTVAIAPIAIDVVSDAQAATRLSLDEARELALREVPGTILEEELEREDGVWVYSFEIAADRATWEVEIDADTGEVVEVEREDDDDDRDDNDD